MTATARSRIGWGTRVLDAVVTTSLVLALVGTASSQPRRDHLDALAFLDGCWAHLPPDWVMTMCWAREGDAWVGTSHAVPFGEWDVDLRIAREDGGLVLPRPAARRNPLRPEEGDRGVDRAGAGGVQEPRPAGRARARGRSDLVPSARGDSGYPLERDRVETATSPR